MAVGINCQLKWATQAWYNKQMQLNNYHWRSRARAIFPDWTTFLMIIKTVTALLRACNKWTHANGWDVIIRENHMNWGWIQVLNWTGPSQGDECFNQIFTLSKYLKDNYLHVISWSVSTQDGGHCFSQIWSYSPRPVYDVFINSLGEKKLRRKTGKVISQSQFALPST